MFKKEELVNDSFIIAEVGQNHQGDLEAARKYIKYFSSYSVLAWDMPNHLHPWGFY